MKLLSIEPTPSPHTMKLNVDETLPNGVKMTYTRQNQDGAPGYVKKLLQIEGVKSVFRVADFIALERVPSGDWKSILSQAGQIFDGAASGAPDGSAQAASETAPAYGEVQVLVQTIRGIPSQIKLVSGLETVRVSLPERFGKAAMQVAQASPHYLKERKWEEKGVRYGELKEIGEQVAQEIDASYDDSHLQRLVEQALEHRSEETEPVPVKTLSPSEVSALLDNPDWKKRYAALEQIKPDEEYIPVLAKALGDPNFSIRRLATVYLGDIRSPEVLPYLYRALKDESVAVRRTAGDCLSDIGNPDAIGPMIQALKDPSKLVRWRAARFLYEAGDESAVPALRAAQDDPEFEVSLQVKMALERIEKGEEASGSVWQQMTRSFSDAGDKRQ